MIVLHIAAMTADDVTEVVRLDGENPSPWTASHFTSQLASPHTWQFIARCQPHNDLGGYICGQLLGQEGEIHKIAVAKELRRQHIGHRLLDHALSFLKDNGAISTFLELRTSNVPAQNLYKFHGFRACGLRKKYYNSPVEDAIIMRLHHHQPLNTA